MNEKGIIKVAIWTDGYGSHQARCLECGWKSAWFERASKGRSTEEKAAEAAEGHFCS